VSDGESASRPVERWITLGTAVIAPVTLITALLFYFGYVSTRASYEFFGVDVDIVGFGTQDYVLRSPRPLLVPLVVILLIGSAALWAHVQVRQLITGGGTRVDHVKMAAGIAAVVGGGGLLAGIVLILVYPAVRHRAVLDLLIPLLLAAGVVLLAYGRYVRQLIKKRPGPNDRRWPTARIVAAALVAAVAIANLFWATATLAQWSGRGEAIDLSQRLDELPSVILDTKERLYIRDPIIDESVLPEGAEQQFRYRYRQLRLLAHGDDRMFLIPAEWTPSGTTLVVPLDEHVRVQFQFENPG
jgi:hypothetical protein